MTNQPKDDTKFVTADDVWKLGDPATIETAFRNLLLQAKALKDTATCLHIMSQIALAQAIQNKFENAHQTLDEAETMLTPKHDAARAKILLERGVFFRQAGNIDEAIAHLKKAYVFSIEHNMDLAAVEAAHLSAIVAQTTAEKLAWNQRAIDIAENSDDPKVRAWLNQLYKALEHDKKRSS
jgi:tetratricopeptide (TPR) repeat protein